MNVRDLNIVLRQRIGWEGVDLGFALTRRSFGDTQKISFLALGPVALLLFAAFWKAPYIAAFLVWWLKPAADRFLLFYLSRQIFGQKVSIRFVFTQWKTLLITGLFPWLSYRRFSPSRGMTMPVSDLEGLRGTEFSSRVRVVTRMGGDTVVLLTIGMLLLQFIMLLALYFAFIAFLPQSGMEEFRDSGKWLMEEGAVQQVARLFLWGSFVVIGLFLEPFFVGGGFALYLNSRTIQEAWDVELIFRELAARSDRAKLKLGSATRAAVPALLLALAALLAMPLRAEDAQDTIKDVLARDEFIIHKEKSGHWVPKGDWQPDFGSGGGGFAGFGAFFQLVGIVALVGLVALIALLLYHTLKGRNLGREKNVALARRAAPSVVLGMEIAPESLPRDLLGEARKRWQEGRTREALSLLYRGALSQLVIERAVDIESSDTESECLARVKKSVPGVADFFGDLSRHWMQAAYSQLPVRGSDFDSLLERWPFVR